jgi:hypothetical protein
LPKTHANRKPNTSDIIPRVIASVQRTIRKSLP